MTNTKILIHVITNSFANLGVGLGPWLDSSLESKNMFTVFGAVMVLLFLLIVGIGSVLFVMMWSVKLMLLLPWPIPSS